jgi:hypothetical protein
VIISPVGVGDVDPTTAVRDGSGHEQALLRRRDELVEREQRSAWPSPSRFVDGRLRAREAQVGDHRSGLLREPDLVEPAHVVAVEHRRGAEHLRDRHHAGSADPGDAQRELVVGHDPRAARGDRGRRGSSRAATSPLFVRYAPCASWA